MKHLDSIIRQQNPSVITIRDFKEFKDINGNDVVVDMEKAQAEYDAQAYARARQPLYPDIGDQLDDLYHKGAFSTEMAAKIKKVKDDNPKG
tara:strand:- start:2623 stop:2895 length:273 start_codon:yes stop_codon:yes gene_type:complete